jgi:hypothetical protein
MLRVLLFSGVYALPVFDAPSLTFFLFPLSRFVGVWHATEKATRLIAYFFNPAKTDGRSGKVLSGMFQSVDHF